MIPLQVPISEKSMRALKVGDQVSLSGVICTARDAAHKYMMDSFIKHECPPAERATYEALRKALRESVIYHCGPVVQQDQAGKWRFLAAGPTTSSREEPYQAAVIEHFCVRGVIGKGGMGPKTLAGLKKTGAAYLHAIGGAASLTATYVTEVLALHKKEFGLPEAFWVIRVENFPLVVTMDAAGNSLHQLVADQSHERLQELLKS